MLALDAAGYLLLRRAAQRRATGTSPGRCSDREPHLLETVRPGVFAAGDVRAGASNRVAGAVGDGALVGALRPRGAQRRRVIGGD